MKAFSRLKFLLFLAAFGFIMANSSCKTGEGCNQDRYQAPTDKNGNLSTKKGKSDLFSKKQKKKMGK
jgi:hypothetical protein